MLVLSRRPDESIVFPNIGVTIRLLRIDGRVARVGIDAPPGLKVFRQELLGEATLARAGSDPSATHALCNQLSRITLSLHLFQRQWQAGLAALAEQTLQKVLGLLEGLDRDWVVAHLGENQPRRRCRTLVVEDDSNERELLAGLLSMSGCECETAEDGQAALDYLSSHERPDFVLLDMWMPRCDGPQTLRTIRRDPRYRGLKVFSISSTAPQDLGIRTGPDGVDAWFPKPLNPRKLWETIQQSLATTARDP